MMDESVKSMVREGRPAADIQERFLKGSTGIIGVPVQEEWDKLFCLAIEFNHCELKELLLQEDKVFDHIGFNPLHAAVHFRDRLLAKLLLDKGLCVNELSWTMHPARPKDFCSQTETAIGLAIKYDDVEMMKILQPFYDPLKHKHQFSLLHYACKYGATECFDLIIEGDVDVNAKAANMFTPLMFAVRSNYDMVEKLISFGADTMIPYETGNKQIFEYHALEAAIHWKIPTIYMHTCRMTDIVRLLLEKCPAKATIKCEKDSENLLSFLCYGARDLAHTWASTQKTREEIKLILKVYLETAKLLLDRKVWESECTRDVFTLAITLATQHLFTQPVPGDSSKTSQRIIAEEFFVYTRDFIRLCLQYNLHRYYKTLNPAGKLIWGIVRKFVQQSHVEDQSYFVVNDQLRFVALEIFDDLLVHGMTLVEKEDIDSLFTLCTMDMGIKFDPFLRAFVNSLDQQELNLLKNKFAGFLRKNRKFAKNVRDDNVLTSDSPRSLRTIARFSIIKCLGGDARKRTQSLILPAELRQHLLYLHM